MSIEVGQLTNNSIIHVETEELARFVKELLPAVRVRIVVVAGMVKIALNQKARLFLVAVEFCDAHSDDYEERAFEYCQKRSETFRTTRKRKVSCLSLASRFFLRNTRSPIFQLSLDFLLSP